MSRMCAVLALLVVSGCGEDTPLQTSCGGDVIPNCRVYEYSVMESATLEPSGVEPGDPTAEVEIQLSFSNCGANTPMPQDVVVRLLGQGSSIVADASTTRIFNLVTLKDDGSTFGDETALDGKINVTIDNPFGSEIPANSNVSLRFEPRLNTCTGEIFEVDYRTGDRWTPPVSP